MRFLTQFPLLETATIGVPLRVELLANDVVSEALVLVFVFQA